MPYEFPEGKLRTVVVLRWIERRQSAAKDAVCVYDVADMLEDLGVAYEDAGRRLNDASQRLRTLFKSGYVKKVLAGYDDDSGISSAACFTRVGKIATGRGRKPDVYVLTERGLRYGRTSADAYLDADGGALERRAFMERLVQRGAAWIVGGVDLRAAVLTRDADGAASAARRRLRSLVESEKFFVDGSTYSGGEADEAGIEE